MPFTLPMLIPIFVGVVFGVTAQYLFVYIRQTLAARQAQKMRQLQEERIEKHRAALSQYKSIAQTSFSESNDDIIRA